MLSRGGNGEEQAAEDTEEDESDTERTFLECTAILWGEERELTRV